MSIVEIIKAWKDEEFRNSLTPEQLQNMPENPTGLIELEEFDAWVNGGSWSTGECSHSGCGGGAVGTGSSG